MTAFRDKPRFGLQDWQREWDGLQEDYFVGKNLTKDEEKLLLTKVGKNQEKKQAGKSQNEMQKITKQIRRQQVICSRISVAHAC